MRFARCDMHSQRMTLAEPRDRLTPISRSRNKIVAAPLPRRDEELQYRKRQLSLLVLLKALIADATAVTKGEE
jgi:hypothetical protein